MKVALKLFALFAIILLSSCKKDFEARQKNTLLLTSPEGWLTVKIEQKEANGSWTDITSGVDPFVADNILVFDPYYKWAINEGQLRSPNKPYLVATGDWGFTDNDATKIQYVGGYLAEINELTETSLQYTYTYTDKLTAITTTNRFTFKHP